MLQFLEGLSPYLTLSQETLVYLGAGLAASLIFVGVASGLGHRNHAADRIARTPGTRGNARFERGLLRETVQTPRGILRAALPSNARDQARQELLMIQAGMTNPRALQYYFMVRLLLGFGLPAAYVAVHMIARVDPTLFPTQMTYWLSLKTDGQILRHLVIIVAAGYYLPTAWLKARIRERKRRITESFPNALDLMQISVEVGLGIDQAMTRVGNELAGVAPDLSAELLATQMQIQAGRPRGEALLAMAERTGVEMVQAFANVTLQAIKFGTSMSEALTTFAAEMRQVRELKAQEKANQLPVKMSGVLASLMLPAVILVTIGPVVIRTIRVFGG